MTQSYKFAVTATAPNGRRCIVSRHTTLTTAQKAKKLAKNNPDFQIISLLGMPIYE